MINNVHQNQAARDAISDEGQAVATSAAANIGRYLSQHSAVAGPSVMQIHEDQALSDADESLRIAGKSSAG